MVGSYASLADSRRLSGGVGTISDADFEDFLLYGNIRIEACTGLKDVDPSDAVYPLMETGAEYYVSSLVRSHYGDKSGYAQKHLEMAEEICKQIINYGLTGSSSARSVSQGYATFPLNPEGLYFSNRYISREDGVIDKDV